MTETRCTKGGLNAKEHSLAANLVMCDISVQVYAFTLYKSISIQIKYNI